MLVADFKNKMLPSNTGGGGMTTVGEWHRENVRNFAMWKLFCPHDLSTAATATGKPHKPVNTSLFPMSSYEVPKLNIGEKDSTLTYIC